MTAESVAELAEMPLYRVASVDLGITLVAAEECLNLALCRGQRWGCILLLEDLDVLMRRSVSIWWSDAEVAAAAVLNVLERYNGGPVILTARELTALPDSVSGRGQATIPYEYPTCAEREAMWQSLFERAREKGGAEAVDAGPAALKGWVRRLAAREMSGRQIRNVMATATELAVFVAKPLGVEHLDMAMKTFLLDQV